MRRGMTLLELLLVTGILALLAAFLLPVFLSARIGARGAVCLSRTRQLGMAFSMYGSDWERFPGSGRAGQNGGEWVLCPEHWNISLTGGSLWPYTRSPDPYRCALDTRRLSFSMNGLLHHLPEGALRHPATTLLLLDEAPLSVGGWGPNDGVWEWDRPWDVLSDRHLGRGVVLWADGHAGTLPPEAVRDRAGRANEDYLVP